MSARGPGLPGDDSGAEEGGGPPEGFRPPLPPEDRLWRHPSEVARQRATRTETASRTAGQTDAAPVGPRLAAFMVASGMIGATLAVGAVALLGGFESSPGRAEAPAAVAADDASSPVTSTVRQRDPVADLAARTAPTVMGVRARTDVDGTAAERAGSAVAYRADGHLLTSAALVEGATSLLVLLPDGTALPGEVVGTDPSTDVAVVHVDLEGMDTATMGTADDLTVGATTVTVAALSDPAWQSSVSTGVVSALGRRLRVGTDTDLHDLILVDAPFGPSAAGGAVVDAAGRVVGLASAHTAAGAGADRFGVATPIDLVRHVADQLIDRGAVAHTWLGVQGRDLDAEAAMTLGLAGGIVVEGVSAPGPASAAGLGDGDVIVGVDGVPVRSMTRLIAALQRRLPGDEIALDVVRDGILVTVRCTLASKTG